MSPCLYQCFFLRALDWAGVQDAFAECALGHTFSCTVGLQPSFSECSHCSRQFIEPVHLEVSLCSTLSCFDILLPVQGKQGLNKLKSWGWDHAKHTQRMQLVVYTRWSLNGFWRWVWNLFWCLWFCRHCRLFRQDRACTPRSGFCVPFFAQWIECVSQHFRIYTSSERPYIYIIYISHCYNWASLLISSVFRNSIRFGHLHLSNSLLWGRPLASSMTYGERFSLVRMLCQCHHDSVAFSSLFFPAEKYESSLEHAIHWRDEAAILKANALQKFSKHRRAQWDLGICWVHPRGRLHPCWPGTQTNLCSGNVTEISGRRSGKPSAPLIPRGATAQWWNCSEIVSKFHEMKRGEKDKKEGASTCGCVL